MSTILNKSTGRFVLTSTRTGKKVIKEQYGGTLGRGKGNKYGKYLLPLAKKLKHGQEMTWTKVAPRARKAAKEYNFDTYGVIRSKDGTYMCCSPGEANCPHQDTTFKTVHEFITYQDMFNEFKGYKHVYIDEKYVGEIK